MRRAVAVSLAFSDITRINNGGNLEIEIRGRQYEKSTRTIWIYDIKRHCPDSEPSSQAKACDDFSS